MIRTGIVKGREFRKNRDGNNTRLMMQVQITDADDIQTVELMVPPGVDVNPPDESKVIVIDVSKAYKIAIVADDNIEPSMLEGEKKIYSINAGTIAAFINLLKSGIIEVNGNADFAVRFTALESAFNELKGDFNQLITDYNGHGHGGVQTGGGTSGVTNTPGTSSSADMSGAKVDTVKLP